MTPICVLITVFLIHFSHAVENEEILLDYRLAIERGLIYNDFDIETTTVTPELQCEEAGYICKNCSIVIQCIDVGDGQFINGTVEECDESKGYYCWNGNCTKDVSICNPIAVIPFKCNAVGMFPDPFDCKKFHVCYKTDTGVVQTCGNMYGYEPISTYCKTKLPKGCENNYPVPICIKEGQTGALSNKSIFYFCNVKIINEHRYLYPDLHLCSNGKIYQNDKCT